MQPPRFGGSLRKQPPPLRQPSMRRARSSVEIQRYAEDEQDEDFSDVFGKGEAILDKPESEQGSDGGTLMLQSKLSNNSWVIPLQPFVGRLLMAHSLVMTMMRTTLSPNLRRVLTRWVGYSNHRSCSI